MAEYRPASRTALNTLLTLKNLEQELRTQRAALMREERARRAALLWNARRRINSLRAEVTRTLTHQIEARAKIAMEDLRIKVVQESENACLKLSITLAEKILKRSVTESAQSLAIELHELLDTLLSPEKAELRLNPDECSEIYVALEERVRDGALTINSDETVENGCCVVNTSTGSLSISWRDTLARHYEEFQRALHSRHGG